MGDNISVTNLLGYISVSLTGIIAIYTIFNNYRSKYYFSFWSPLTFISLVYLYYVVISPTYLLLINKTQIYNIQFSNTYVSWIAAFVAYTSILLGFKYYRGLKKPFWSFNITYDQSFRYGMILFVIGAGLYISIRGFQFNAFEVDDSRKFVTGGFTMYVMMMISLLVPASGLIVYGLIKKKRIYYLIPLIITLILFITQGSRYRLVFLVVTLATVYYNQQQKKLNPLLWITIGTGFFLFMGVIEVTRNYSRGLDLTKMEGMKISDIALSSQNEVSVFFFSGDVINYVQRTKDYIYFEPVLTAVLMPFPRVLFPTKPSGEYLRKVQNKTLGSSQGGAAFLHYAEAFYAFGWIGVIINGILIGMLSKAFWINFLRQREGLISILILSLFNGLLYTLISRGYLAQTLTDFFFFIVIPLLIIKNLKRLIK